MSAPAAPPSSVKVHPWLQTGINYLTISLMAVCITAVVLEIPRRFTEDWHGSYLLFLSFLIAWEALISHRMAEEFTQFSGEWIVHHATEWVVILVVVKGLMYLLNGPARILVDIPLWEKDFFNNFFTLDYTLVCLYLLFLWIFTTTMANNLANLEEDIELLELERQGDAHNDRNAYRQSLMATIFVAGAILLFITAMVHVDLPFYNTPFEYRPSSAVFLLLYFLLGFVLMAQSQYSILRARWYIQSIPISADITRRWLPFSFLMLVITTAVAFLLPTRYSSGLFSVLQSALTGIINALLGFFALIVAFLTTLLSHLFGAPKPQQVPQATPAPQPTLVPVPPVTIATPAWLELLQNILFWTIFVTIIFFAFRYYLGQRKGAVDFLKRLPIWTFLKKAWKWLTNQYHHLNRAIAAVVESGVARLREIAAAQNSRADPWMAISRRLPPRQRVLLVYLVMVRWNGQNGIYRKGSETPYEYARSLQQVLPEAEPDIKLITSAFMEARYTRHDITRDQAEQAQNTWEQFQEKLKAYLELQKQLQTKV